MPTKRTSRCRRSGAEHADDLHLSLPIVAAVRRPSTSYVLATLRALQVDRLLIGGKGQQLSSDVHLHAERRSVGILSVVQHPRLVEGLRVAQRTQAAGQIRQVEGVAALAGLAALGVAYW
jgi:hypothetical protein